MTTFVQDPVTKKFVEKQAYLDSIDAPAVHTMTPFKSPIDGTIITDSAQLRAHHKKHGTTDSRDYSPEFTAKARRERELKLTGQDKDSKRDRLNKLIQSTQNVRT